MGLLSRRAFLRLAAVAGVAAPWLAGLEPLVGVAEAAAVRHVRDVLRFSTGSQGRRGLLGFVTVRLHPVFFDGGRAYRIRTDASDRALVRSIGLVHVPKLAKAIESSADAYTFTNGVAGQLPVISTAPGQSDFTPAFRIHRVTFTGAPSRLTSVAQVRDAASGGRVRIASTNVVVNYPVPVTAPTSWRVPAWRQTPLEAWRLSW